MSRGGGGRASSIGQSVGRMLRSGGSGHSGSNHVQLMGEPGPMSIQSTPPHHQFASAILSSVVKPPYAHAPSFTTPGSCHTNVYSPIGSQQSHNNFNGPVFTKPKELSGFDKTVYDYIRSPPLILPPLSSPLSRSRL